MQAKTDPYRNVSPGPRAGVLDPAKMPDHRTPIFKRFEVLKNLPADALDDLAGALSWTSAPAGKQIVLANEPCGDVYFIVDGRVKVLLYSAAEGKPVLFVTLRAFEMFGEMAAIDGSPRSATVEAEDDCVLAVLSREQFLRLIRAYPAFSFAVMKQLVAQVRRLSDRVYEFSTLGVQARVYAELLRVVALAGEQNGQALLSPAPLLVDLAARVSTHREAVSRVISRLQDNGILRREGANIRVLEIDRLRRLLREEKGE
ncbi:MAG TPA: Crp/Fnr family transcriptional regulator [Geobacterales bacterium]|nr:Crp/Fnr family transcriptional regulator [Geobacterales bacterium]